MNAESINESEDPESTRDVRTRFGNESDINESIRESGFKRADALRVTILHKGVQHNPQVVCSLKDCLIFF